MTSKRSKCCAFLLLIFISKSVSKKLLIKIKSQLRKYSNCISNINLSLRQKVFPNQGMKMLYKTKKCLYVRVIWLLLYLAVCMVIRVDMVIILLVLKVLFVTKFTIEHLFQIFQAFLNCSFLLLLILWKETKIILST